MKKVNISAAGNVETPAYLSLLNSGYSVRKEMLNEQRDTWIAEKDGNRFTADGPIELLGVVKVYEIRGDNWKATDEEIDKFISEFDLD